MAEIYCDILVDNPLIPMDPNTEKVRLTLQIIAQTLPKKVLGSIGYR